MRGNKLRDNPIAKSEKKEGDRNLHSRELVKYPELQQHREVNNHRQMELRFQEKNPRDRVLGLPIVKGFDRSGVMTDTEVREYLKNQFPEHHVNNINIEKVSYRDSYIGTNKEKELGHWESRQLVKDIEIYDKNIVINRQSPEGSADKAIMKDTLAHEVGHQVHNSIKESEKRRGLQFPGMDTVTGKWEKISGNRPEAKCVSGYARTTQFEDFAETYCCYVRDPEKLRQVSPEKYNFMKDYVFVGKEYSGR